MTQKSSTESDPTSAAAVDGTAPALIGRKDILPDWSAVHGVGSGNLVSPVVTILMFALLSVTEATPMVRFDPPAPIVNLEQGQTGRVVFSAHNGKIGAGGHADSDCGLRNTPGIVHKFEMLSTISPIIAGGDKSAVAIIKVQRRIRQGIADAIAGQGRSEGAQEQLGDPISSYGDRANERIVLTLYERARANTR